MNYHINQINSYTDRKWIVTSVTGSMYDDEMNSTYAFVKGRFTSTVDKDGDVRIDECFNDGNTEMRMYIPKESLNFMIIMTDKDMEGINLDFKFGEDGYNLL